jgi:hypothetical protein
MFVARRIYRLLAAHVFLRNTDSPIRKLFGFVLISAIPLSLVSYRSFDDFSIALQTFSIPLVIDVNEASW